MLFGFSARNISGQANRSRMSRSLEMRVWFIKAWGDCAAPSLVLRNSADKSNNKPLRFASLVVFPFGVHLALLTSVRLPGLRDHIRMNRILVLHGPLGMRKLELWRIGKARHPFVPIRDAQNDCIPVAMRVRRHVAKVWHCSIEHPRAAAVSIRRVAAVAHKFLVQHFALVNCFFAGRYLLRLR